MRGAQVLFMVASFFKVALLLFPAREQFYIFYKIDRGFTNHLIVTSVICIIAFGIPCVYPDITKLLGLFGGITAGSSGYSIPILLHLVYLKSESKLLSTSGLLHLMLLLIVVTIQVLSVYVSLTQNSGGH
jgi:hypothetical protein